MSSLHRYITHTTKGRLRHNMEPTAMARRRALRYRLDGLTVVVMLLSMLMLNVLLFSAGFLMGVTPSEARVIPSGVEGPVRAGQQERSSRPASVPKRTQLATSIPQPFVMPRWTPPAEPQPAPIEPAPVLVAYRQRDYTALIEETAYRE